MHSHAIWALFWSILIQNWIKKQHSRSKFWGGVRLLRPPLDPPVLYVDVPGGEYSVHIRDVRVQILTWFQTFLLFTKPHFQTFNALKSTSFQAFQIISDFFSQMLSHPWHMSIQGIATDMGRVVSNFGTLVTNLHLFAGISNFVMLMGCESSIFAKFQQFWYADRKFVHIGWETGYEVV